MSQVRNDRITGIGFLIVVAALALSGHLWPGILVVTGVVTVIRGLLQRLPWKTIGGILWLMAVALVFNFGFPWPLLPLLAAIGIIVGARHERSRGRIAPQAAQHVVQNRQGGP